MSYQTLSVERDGPIATVTLLAPTMPPLFFEECGTFFKELADDESTRVMIVRGGGKAFSYGLDLRAAAAALGPHLSGGSAKQRTELRNLILGWQAAFSQLQSLPFPTIAAVHGACIGGGLDLVTACDIRLTETSTFFSLRETKIAIVADLGSLQRLPAIIGQGHLREMAFTGKDVAAARAKEIGLVNDVYASREALDDAARTLATEIAENPPLTVRGVKHVLDRAEQTKLSDGLAYVATYNAAYLATQDLTEAMMAFMEKRKPSFKGE